MSCTHLTSMERTKIEFFVAQGSRVCLLLSIQIPPRLSFFRPARRDGGDARWLSWFIYATQRVGADPCVCPS